MDILLAPPGALYTMVCYYIVRFPDWLPLSQYSLQITTTRWTNSERTQRTLKDHSETTCGAHPRPKTCYFWNFLSTFKELWINILSQFSHSKTIRIIQSTLFTRINRLFFVENWAPWKWGTQFPGAQFFTEESGPWTFGAPENGAQLAGVEAKGLICYHLALLSFVLVIGMT